MTFTYENEYDTVITDIASDPAINSYADLTFKCPAPFIGNDEIKLIILGQDPTVKNPQSRKKIKTVLNLDVEGSLRRYISKICSNLNINVNNVYATNLIKNFFLVPPANNAQLIAAYAQKWHEVLMKELAQYPNIPIISLGEPVLQPVVFHGSKKVRDYWGYCPGAPDQSSKLFEYIKPVSNILSRPIFPLPHQPSISKKLYHNNFDDYMFYVKNEYPF